VLAALGSVKAATFMARFFVMIVEEMVLLLKVLQAWTKVNDAIIFHSRYKLMLMGCTRNRKYMLP
jgi:uncharacterized protein YbgA (DUF1722 family)